MRTIRTGIHCSHLVGYSTLCRIENEYVVICGGKVLVCIRAPVLLLYSVLYADPSHTLLFHLSLALVTLCLCRWRSILGMKLVIIKQRG